MDIVNNIQFCVAGQSAAAFRAYISAGCKSGAELDLLDSDLDDWILQYLEIRPNLAQFSRPLKDFLAKQNRDRCTDVPGGCFSVVAILEALCCTGQTLEHQALIWNVAQAQVQQRPPPQEHHKQRTVAKHRRHRVGPFFRKLFGRASAVVSLSLIHI